MITRPIRATVGNPRCSVEGCEGDAWAKGMCQSHYRKSLYARHKAQGRVEALYPGTTLSSENKALLSTLGITYRQWNYWHSKGWLSGSFEDVDLDLLKRLARAAKIQAMPLNQLADLLKEKELERL